jgi:DNA (cytosine-5)-methyltransferase 1
MYKVVSLFSGCGGLDLGFLGNFYYLNEYYDFNRFEIVFANEINKDACLTYSYNFKHKITCNDVRSTYGLLPTKTDILLGGFPCQDFSVAGKRKGFKNKERGQLYKAVIETVKKTNPLIFVCENVPGLLSINKGQSIKQIEKEFTELGYFVSINLYNVSDFGVPQNRKRVLIIATKKDCLPIFGQLEKPNAQNLVTSEMAIKDLENITEKKASNHCWSKAKRNIGQGNIAIKADGLAPTIRAEHHGNIEFHYNNTRRLSVRECARLQSFPDDFIFASSTSSNYRQIGNAVPPIFAWYIAKNIQKFLANQLMPMRL